jgi:hypothetical protein
MRALIGTVLTVWLILLAGEPALADKRVALVIGNSSYRNVAKLSNPANDAAAIAALFKSAGFDAVDTKLNLTVGELRKALRDFASKTRDADVAVVITPDTASNWTAPIISFQSTRRLRQTEMSSMRRCRWTECCLPSNRPSNCGL